MRWSFSIQQKLKAAGLLFGLLLVILLTAISLKNAVRNIDQTVESLYADRLQPAVDLVDISESLHAKRFLLEQQFTNESSVPPAALAGQLNQYDQQIANRVSQFEKTKLTANEVIWLKAFKQDWTQGKRLEASIQRLLATGQRLVASKLFHERGATLFRRSVQSVHELAQIQVKTGQKVVKDAHRVAAGGSLDATLLTALSLVIGLVILGLIHNSTLLNQESPPFHLN